MKLLTKFQYTSQCYIMENTAAVGPRQRPYLSKFFECDRVYKKVVDRT